MSNQLPIICTRCGTPLDPNQLAGLCPLCLAARHFATDTAAPDASARRQEPPPSPEEIAASLPQLEAIEFLGRGGMGVVYKATQKSLGRTVALKLLAPERLGDADFAARFEREAKALAALNHPNIVTIHDFGKAGEFYYLVMEFIDGVNLRQAMSAGRFTPEQSLAIVPPVCEALQYAHEHGIVHRDIKPENVLLDKEGRVKIADFGIAKMLDTGMSIADTSESQPAGTPQYMAPEQKERRVNDHRTDIYSLGVVLYEMLTGELPADKLQPPSRKVQIDVRLDEIVLRALEVKPELRFATAAEFRSQVEAATSQVGEQSSGKTKNLNRYLTGPAAQIHVSRFAVIGACWVPVAVASLLTAHLILRVPRDGVNPLWWQLGVLVPLLIIAVAGPFGTTILGWLAVAEISRSHGKIHGLQLAIFDGLFYPLTSLSAIIAGGIAYAVRELSHESMADHAAVLFAIVIAVVVDAFIVGSVMRAVRAEAAAAPRDNSFTGNQIKLASLALIFALMSAALGAMSAIRHDGPWTAMALALIFAGIAVIMAIPVRRIGAGMSALAVASLGMIIWPVAAFIIQRANSATHNTPLAPEIERVEVSNEQAVVKARGSDDASMAFRFGDAANHWTPSGLYLDAMFDVSLSFGGFERGTRWNIKPRHGLHSRYWLDGLPGPIQGRIAFHPGTPAADTEGAYVIGEFRPDDDAPVPIAVKIVNDKAESSYNRTARDPDALAKALMAKPPSPPKHIDIKVLRVENPPGTRDILLHFERDTNYGLAIEVWQNVTASPDGKVPKDGYRTWQQKTSGGLNGGRVLGWTLPEEFTVVEVSSLAKEMEKKWKRSHPLPDGAVPEFATAIHRDGWKYHLAAKVLREPGSPRPAAPAGALFTAEQPIDLPADALVRLTLEQSANDGPKTRLGEAYGVNSSEPAPGTTDPVGHLPRKSDEWTDTLLTLAKEAAEAIKLPEAKPEDLVSWGPEKDGMRAGLLIAGRVGYGQRLRTRLVFRNVSNGTKELQLTFTKYAIELSATAKDGTSLSTTTPMLLGSNARIPVTLKAGEQIEMEGWTVQFGENKQESEESACLVETGLGKVMLKFKLQNLPLPDTGGSAVIVEPTLHELPETQSKPQEAVQQIPMFGPVVERKLSHAGDTSTDIFLDLDTEQFVEATPDVSLLQEREVISDAAEQIAIWAKTSGADLMIDSVSPKVTAILFGGYVSAPRFSFDNSAADEVLKIASDTWRLRESRGESLPPMTMFDRVDSNDDAVLFRTREGGIGLLQIINHTVEPRSVTLRYKLLTQPERTQSCKNVDSYFFSSLPPWWLDGPDEANLQPVVLIGHSDWIKGLAFSPDGKRLASASRDTTIKLWDVETGKESLTLKRSADLNDGHTGYVEDVQFSPDGKYLASVGSSEQTIRVWNPVSGRNIHTLTSGGGVGASALAFSPDGTRLATAGSTVRIFDMNLEVDRDWPVVELGAGEPFSVAFSPDGQRLATVRRDRSLRVSNPVTSEEILHVKHEHELYSVSFSPDGKRLATASMQDVILWDADTGKVALKLQGATEHIHLAFSPDGQWLATAGWNKVVKLWNTQTGREVLRLSGHGNNVWAVEFSPDGKRLATGGADRIVRIWDVDLLDANKQVSRPRGRIQRRDAQ